MIETTYTLSQADFVEAQKLWRSREVKKLPGRILQQAVSIVLGGFIGWSFYYLPFWLTLALCLSLLSVRAVDHWRKKAIRQYQYNLQAQQMESVHVRIDESGYKDEKDGVCGGWISWAAFTGWVETPTSFVLRKNLFYITVPKASLSQEQQKELVHLLETRLGARRS